MFYVFHSYKLFSRCLLVLPSRACARWRSYLRATRT